MLLSYFRTYFLHILIQLSNLQEEDNHNHYMDSGKEIFAEVTRESLIALSYSQPNKDLSVQFTPKNSNAKNLIKAVNGEEYDDYRSKLITMYYPKLPDTKVETSHLGTLGLSLN